MSAVRVLIVDDHRAFGDALAARLDQEPDLEVVGTATTSQEALRLAVSLGPDVVTVDVELGGEDGIVLSARLSDLASGPRVVMVTCVEDVQRTVEAVRSGSVVWVSKDIPSKQLVEILRGAVRGEGYLAPRLLAGVLQELTKAKAREELGAAQLARLTARELEVVQCMVDGLDRATIARQLLLTTNTVRTHVQNALSKLDAHSSLEAVAVARRCGLQSRAEAGRQRLT